MVMVFDDEGYGGAIQDFWQSGRVGLNPQNKAK